MFKTLVRIVSGFVVFVVLGALITFVAISLVPDCTQYKTVNRIIGVKFDTKVVELDDGTITLINNNTVNTGSKVCTDWK